MLSFWERESFTVFDVLVIGGGITGLSTAISLKERNSKLNVAVVERGTLPIGASTKNAGFACFGSLTEIIDDINQFGADKARQLVEWRMEGLHLLRNRLGDGNIDYIPCGGYELIGSQDIAFLERIDGINELLHPIFSSNPFQLVPQNKFKFSAIEEIVFTGFEGALDTGKMISTLLSKAQALNVRVLSGVSVRNFTDEVKCVTIEADFSNNESVAMKCKKLIMCTNAFTSELGIERDINPGRGIVLVTKPLSKVPFEGTFHMDKGYYYFRNVGSRVLIGGGRNLDFEGESTTEFAIPGSIKQEIINKLDNIILPDISYEVDMEWAGIMAFGKNKLPIIEYISENVLLSTRLGGMGVAIGSKLGELTADKTLDLL